MDSLRQDITNAARRLGHSPGFAAIAILTLSLGIGANSAIFGVVYGVMLKPLTFPEAERLVRLYQLYQGERAVFSPPNFLDVQQQAKSLDSAAAFDGGGFTLTQG